MNGETGFCIASGSGRSLSVGLLRIRGELAIGALFVPQTSHEGRDRQGSALMMWPAMWIGSRIAASANVSETSSHRLITRAPVGSLGLRPGRSSLFCFIKQCLLMLALWSCGRRGSVVQAQRQIHRVLLAGWPRAPRCIGSVARAHCGLPALMPAEPHIRSPLQSG